MKTRMKVKNRNDNHIDDKEFCTVERESLWKRCPWINKITAAIFEFVPNSQIEIDFQNSSCMC